MKKLIFLTALLISSTTFASYDTVVRVLDRNGRAVKNAPVTVEVVTSKKTLVSTGGLPVFKDVGEILDQKIWLTNQNGEAYIDLSILNTGSIFTRGVKFKVQIGFVSYVKSSPGSSSSYASINESHGSYSLIINNCDDGDNQSACSFEPSNAPDMLISQAQYSTAEELAESITQAYRSASQNQRIVPIVKN